MGHNETGVMTFNFGIISQRYATAIEDCVRSQAAPFSFEVNIL